MRKIGYFKFIKQSAIKDGIYKYIIDPKDNFFAIINPVLINEYHGWRANKYHINLGFRKGEIGAWTFQDECEILKLTPALKTLYGVEDDNGVK